MNPTQAPTQVLSAQQQLADIKTQTAKIVNLARKQDPNIKVNVADAETIGLKLDIPTQKKQITADPALGRVGSAPIAKTGFDTAKNAILDSVPEEDRDTIAQILDVSTGLQTERGSELETQLDDFSSQRMNLAESSAERKRERGDLLTQARLPEAEAELESIRAEGDVLSAKRNMAIQNESRRSGVSTTAQNLNIGAIEKDFSLQQANLAIRELASVGKINAATRLIDSKLDIKYGDIEAETELVQAQIEAILPLLSREDKKVAETRLLLNQQVQAKMTEARESDKALEEFKLQSYLFAQQNGASPAVLSNIMSAESREDVASVGGTAITDPAVDLQRRVQEANIAQSQASARASDALATERLSGGDTVSTVSGETIQVPTFEEYLKENGGRAYAMDSLSKEQTAELRQSYDDEVGVMEQAQRVGLLTPIAREVVNNPQAYYDFTATQKGEIFEELANAGLDSNEIISGKKKTLPATQVSDISQARGVKEDVEKLYTMLQDIEGTGPIMGRLQKLDPYNDKRVAIEAQITRIVPGLARGIFNEVGVLTDTDVERYKNTLANANMTDSQIELLHTDTMAKIDQSLSETINTFGLAGYDVEGFQSEEVTDQVADAELSDDEAYAEYLKTQE